MEVGHSPFILLKYGYLYGHLYMSYLDFVYKIRLYKKT